MSTTTLGSHRYIFTWTVEKPFERQKSNRFYIKGYEVYLIFDFKFSTYYCLELHAPSTFPLFSNYDITVRVETKSKKSLPNLLRKLTIGPEYNKIWIYTEKEIVEAYPNFIEDGTLTFLVCDVDPPKADSVQKEEKSVQTSNYLNDVSWLENLSTDFSQLLQNEDEECGQNVELTCQHNIIKAEVLSARSKAISAMLQNDIFEDRNDMQTFDQFVRYLYTGRLFDLTVNTAKRLYEVGDKYDVSSLKKRCASFLEESLTVDNACEMLAFAHAYNDEDFKECVMKFIMEQEIPLDDGQWLLFCESHPKLGIEVFSSFCKFQKRRHCMRTSRGRPHRRPFFGRGSRVKTNA